MDSVWTFVINPRNGQELLRFYFLWVFVVFVFHLVWDRVSTATNHSNWMQLKSKITELYSAATVVSSCLLACILMTDFTLHPLFYNDGILVPLVLAAFTGLIVGLSGLIPKPVD